jgi:hypothetical protein
MDSVYGKFGERNPLNYIICWKVKIVVIKYFTSLCIYTLHSTDNVFPLLIFATQLKKGKNIQHKYVPKWIFVHYKALILILHLFLQVYKFWMGSTHNFETLTVLRIYTSAN